ncbi:MAG: hypothetical protein PVI03_07135 [Candidatus Thorarchaeota archaeon]|jgi:membrane-bound ClpP family serine protease
MSAALALMGGGTLLQASGILRGGKAARQRGTKQRIYNEIAAGQVIAVGQRKALEQKRQAELMASRALAVSAAGGAAQDMDNIIADIHGEGLYRANVAMYEAETEAENLRFEGLMAEETGKELEEASQIQALGTVLSGGAMMMRTK